MAPSSICPVALTIVPDFHFHCIRCKNGFDFSLFFGSDIWRMRSEVGALYMRMVDLFLS
jgi:hypothetical protein